MLRRHFMTESDNYYNEDDIIIQYKSDKHIKFFGNITKLYNPSGLTEHIFVKYDEYNDGIGTYIIDTNYDNFDQMTSLLITDGISLYSGSIGYVVSINGTIYPTDDTIAIVTEITILNGGMNMALFNYYSEFVTKITVKSNNFNYIPTRWCMNYNSLEEIELGEGVNEIGSYAFTQNANLKHIILPSSIEYINYNIVDTAYNVEITYLGTKNQWNNINKVSEWNSSGCITVVHCTDGDVEL